MTLHHKIIQLFNVHGDESSTELAPDSGPSHIGFEQVLENSGFVAETISPYTWPWNPAARMHSAYLGLDPLRAVRVLLTRRKVAIVCAHLESGLLILLLRRLFRFRPPVVIWEVPWSPGWTYREIVSRLAISRADCCVVFSSSQIKTLHDNYGYDKSIIFIPFYIDTDFYRPLPRPAGVEPYVFSCGLDAGRDFDILLDVSANIPGRILIKMGRDSMASQAVPSNVSVVRDHLSYEKYRELYAGASIVVVTTRDTPNAAGVTTLMEAMAMGKPVIVSDNPALRDYLPPLEAGIVIPIGDRISLQAAIIGLLENPLKAEAMGQRAREFALKNFHPRLHVQAVATLLKNINNKERRL